MIKHLPTIKPWRLNCLFIFVSILFMKPTMAQEWCPPGAVWHHTWVPHPFHNQYKGTVEDRYVGDSTITGKLCKKIKGTFIGTTGPYGSGPVDTIENFRRSFTYLEDSVLYIYNGSGFDTVVNFNAAIGDQWLRNTYNLGSFCNARRAVTVIDTNRIMINNFNLKRIVTTYSNTFTYGNNTYTNTVVDEIVERMMTNSKYLFPMYCEADNMTDLYIYNGELICYEDEKFSIYKRAGFSTCSYVTSVIELTAEAIGLRMHPNPANSLLNVDIKKADNYLIQVRDVLGKSLIEKTSKGGTLQLELGDFDLGIYFLSITTRSGLSISEKIIKN